MESKNEKEEKEKEIARLQETIKKLQKTKATASSMTDNEEAAEVILKMAENTEAAMQSMLTLFTSDTYKKLETIFTGITSYIKKVSERVSLADLVYLDKFREGMEKLMPYIQEELASFEEKNNGKKLSFNEFMQSSIDSETGKPTKSVFERCLEKAKENNEIGIQNIFTKAPKQLLTPTDKVSIFAFDGNGTLYDSKYVGVVIGKKKSKEILSMVSINFDDKSVTISGQKELTPYDRAVYEAVTSLYIDGNNKYFTPQMVYRVLTGNPSKRLSSKQLEIIENSLRKLMYSRIKIEASKEECEAYGFDKFTYQGMVMAAEKATIVMNGEVVEAYHLLREPVLYTYASLKKQIGRLDIKLLDSPVSKNEETITLQSYLYRRILAMKGKSHLNPTILYSSIYEHLHITTASEASLWKKKFKIRKSVKAILDYWVEERFITGYKENKENRNEMTSITIEY